jgi:hypothetical protein
MTHEDIVVPDLNSNARNAAKGRDYLALIVVNLRGPSPAAHTPMSSG